MNLRTYLLVPCAALLLCFAAHATAEEHSRDKRLVGGEDAQFGELFWIVQFTDGAWYKEHDDGTFTRTNARAAWAEDVQLQSLGRTCSGTMLSEYYVLTSAYCAYFVLDPSGLATIFIRMTHPPSRSDTDYANQRPIEHDRLFRHHSYTFEWHEVTLHEDSNILVVGNSGNEITHDIALVEVGSYDNDEGHFDWWDTDPVVFLPALPPPPCMTFEMAGFGVVDFVEEEDLSSCAADDDECLFGKMDCYPVGSFKTDPDFVATASTKWNCFTKKMQRAVVPLVENERCDEVMFYDHDVYHCAGCFFMDGVDQHVGPCEGDRGGPLWRTDSTGAIYQYGIISGTTCSASKAAVPMLYLDTRNYIDWLCTNAPHLNCTNFEVQRREFVCGESQEQCDQCANNEVPHPDHPGEFRDCKVISLDSSCGDDTSTQCIMDLDWYVADTQCRFGELSTNCLLQYVLITVLVLLFAVMIGILAAD